MQYPEIIKYLYKQLPMFHRIGPAAYKANLNNTIALAKYFNNPEKNFKSIHVAGTNGKGSVAHMIASVLQEKGLKTGLCTSPHLKDFRERIKINGKMVPKKYVCDFINNNKSLINNISPSFFELTVVMTFKYFSDQKTDIAVVETGMGGRLDSTNIILPLVSVITNIGLDHTDLLGNTMEKIAAEKAGIIKPVTPVIIGKTQNPVCNIFREKAAENNSPLFFADQSYDVVRITANKDLSVSNYKYLIRGKNRQFTAESNLGGIYQSDNITTVMQTIDVLNSHYKMNISPEQIIEGLKNVVSNTGLKGRWQIIGKQPLVICDSAHNTEAIKTVLNQLNTLSCNRLHIIIGIMNDKNIEELLPLLPVNARYYFTNADVPRALDAQTLKDKAQNYNLRGEAYDNVKNALRYAKRNAKKNDLIFVGGSTFVVAEVI